MRGRLRNRCVTQQVVNKCGNSFPGSYDVVQQFLGVCVVILSLESPGQELTKSDDIAQGRFHVVSSHADELL